MARFVQRDLAARVVLALGLGVLISCQKTPTNSATQAGDTGEAKRRGSGLMSGPARDLSRDEAAGGHILRKHVGKSDDELRERLAEEPQISGASTYTDRETAEHVVGAAIAESRDRIERWLNRSGGHANLVLDYDSPEPIGRTFNRGESQSHPCSHALIVLKYAGPSNYYVLTSYPECR